MSSKIRGLWTKLSHHNGWVHEQRVWVIAATVFVLTVILYWLSAASLGRTQSPDEAYFNDLADAFLQGRSYLINPPSQYDLTLYNGKRYVPFPPLPALLMLPWVAVSGVERVNTVLFAVVMGAANVALTFLLLRSLATRGWTRLRLTDNLWLTALFGIGSVHWYVATLGTVWFVSQICTVTFILLAVWAAVATGSPILSGSALAAAMLARPHVALCYPLPLAIAIQQSRERNGRLQVLYLGRWMVLSLAPMILVVAGLLEYNGLRFGNMSDFGYLKENVSDALINDLRKYGQFNLHYAPRNLWAMWLSHPVWDKTINRLVPIKEGMSLLLTTPALIYLLRARQRSIVVTGAWIAFGLLLINGVNLSGF